MSKLIKLSIVTTLYKSSTYIEEFCHRAKSSAERLSEGNYEIILVNDGSPDNSLAIAIQLAEKDSHINIIDLSRNFGHHKAIMAGLAQARGDNIFLLDSDLEEEPEWLSQFSEKMSQENCDVVYGIQECRKGSWFENWSGSLFYYLINKLSGFDIPKNWVTARLMTRRYVNALLLHNEREISIGGLYLLTGFDQRSSTIKKHCTSASTYTLKHKIAVLVDSITSLSNKPLIAIFYIGLIIVLMSGLNIIYLLFNRLVMSAPISGWTSVMASVWFLGGLIVLFIGIIGIYLSKVFLEAKQRPNSIVRHIYSNSDNGKLDNEI